MARRVTWTPAQDARLAACYAAQRRGLAQLAHELGRDIAALRTRACRLGLSARPVRRWTAAEDACLIAGVLPPARSWAGAAIRSHQLGLGGAVRGPWAPEEDLALLARRCPAGRTWTASHNRARRLGIA